MVPLPRVSAAQSSRCAASCALSNQVNAPGLRRKGLGHARRGKEKADPLTACRVGSLRDVHLARPLGTPGAVLPARRRNFVSCTVIASREPQGDLDAFGRHEAGLRGRMPLFSGKPRGE